VVVLCGKGNNAGDGLVAGRYLAGWGAHVTAALVLGEALPGAAGEALRRFPGRRVAPEGLEAALGRADLIVDALFGVGLSRPPEGAAARAIALASAAGAPVLAVDVPSGVDADTGQVLRAAVRAARTVTLGGLKPGLLFEPGRSLAGTVEVADIGVPPDLRGAAARALEASDVRALLPVRAPDAHKRRVGTVLLVAGSRAMPGAACLAAEGAVHGGAGLVVVATPEPVVPSLVARVPEATTIPLPETDEGTLDEKAVDLLRPRLGELHAAAIGPGLSTHPAAVEAVRALVGVLEVPLVIDADAITALAGAPEVLRRRRAPTLLTPHAGELARLVGRPAAELERDRLRAAREAAAGLGATVLLKGPGTVVCSPEGEAFLTLPGGPALAQGGTGDVLTGLAAALLAQDAARPEPRGAAASAALAAWLHGRAGDRLAARLWPHPANASRLAAELADVLHEVAG
jgi:hydroxyethylthiazole kinase-like uncharacterized protein yjeF